MSEAERTELDDEGLFTLVYKWVYRKEKPCLSKSFTCSEVSFGNRPRLSKVTGSSLSPVFYWNKHIATIGMGSTHYTLSNATALTDSTTRGWKVALKLFKGNAERTLSAEFQAEYSEQYTKAKATTLQESQSIKCPADSSCDLYTMTVMVTTTGVCDNQKRVQCGSQDVDICQDFQFRCEGPDIFRRDASHAAKRCPRGHNKKFDWQTWSCSQYRDFAWKHCKRGKYKKAPCSITLPLLKADGSPANSVIGVFKSIKKTESSEVVKRQHRKDDQRRPDEEVTITIIKPLDIN